MVNGFYLLIITVQSVTGLRRMVNVCLVNK